jgi:hypothetical protein
MATELIEVVGSNPAFMQQGNTFGLKEKSGQPADAFAA